MSYIINKKLKEIEAKHIIPDDNGTIEIPMGTEIIGERAFDGRKDIRKVILPDGIIKIEDSAFNACHNLIEINIPNTVRYIEKDAFARCFKLRRLTFPDGIKVISMGVCQHCSSLEEIYIPDSVTLISRIAFWYCYHLTEVHLPSSICEIEDEAFDGCPDIRILAPKGSYSEEYAQKANINYDANKKFTSNIDIGNQTESISNAAYAFISYSTKNQDAADAMREVLKKRGINIWMAPGDIPAGSKYAAVINKAIKNCNCLILMLLEASQNSIWVAKEVERAVHYQKPIVPVQIENVILNDEFEFYISTDQIVALKKIDESSAAMKKILISVERLLGINQVETEKSGDSTLFSDNTTAANKVIIENPGFEPNTNHTTIANLKNKYIDFIKSITNLEFGNAKQYFAEGNDITVLGEIFLMCQQVLEKHINNENAQKEFSELLLIFKTIYKLAVDKGQKEICQFIQSISTDDYIAACNDIKAYITAEVDHLDCELTTTIFKYLSAYQNNPVQKSYWESLLKEVFRFMKLCDEFDEETNS